MTDRATPATVEIAAKMCQLRKARGWSGSALAQRIPGWNRTTVAKLETGVRRSLTVDELIDLAAVFAVPVTDLLPGHGERPSAAVLVDQALATLLEVQGALASVNPLSPEAKPNA